MKQPQFGLRLILLVVVLFAAIFAYFRENRVIEEEARRDQRNWLLQRLESYERDKAEIIDTTSERRRKIDAMHEGIDIDVANIDATISSIRKKLDLIEP
jgi:hypothetical protein